MLTGQGAVINMPSVQGELVFEICATLTELERELTLECAKAGFAGARETSRLNDAAETPTDVASTRQARDRRRSSVHGTGDHSPGSLRADLPHRKAAGRWLKNCSPVSAFPARATSALPCIQGRREGALYRGITAEN